MASASGGIATTPTFGRAAAAGGSIAAPCRFAEAAACWVLLLLLCGANECKCAPADREQGQLRGGDVLEGFGSACSIGAGLAAAVELIVRRRRQQQKTHLLLGAWPMPQRLSTREACLLMMSE